MRPLSIARRLAPALLACFAATLPADAALRVHPENPRWLTEDGGESAIVLTGAHTWSIFQDHRGDGPFDAASYLDGLARRGHNFTRGWYWEDGFYEPLPYARESGIYRLSPPYERDYVSRLRRRVRAARQRGLYVSVMLFQGWSMTDQGGLRRPNPWPENPYNNDNHDERVSKQHAALHIGVAQPQQLEYVAHVAGKLCSEPNVIWEVSNESHHDSLGTARATNWQASILEQLERECRRRLTWVSCPASGDVDAERGRDLNARMYEMEADLVSPCDPDELYSAVQPAANGRKVVITDTDHLRMERIDAAWAWKAFLRGQHPIFMDLTQELDWWWGAPWETDDPRWREVRRALGAIQELVAVVNRTRGSSPASGLGEMAPQRGPGGRPGARDRPASSPWALYSSDEPCRQRRAGAKCARARANGEEILAWAEGGEALRLCRLEAEVTYRYRWKKTARPGFVAPAAAAAAGANGCLDLANPAADPAVVHLERLVG